MQKVLSHRVWEEVRRHATKARSRKAAIAYVTRDLIGFKKGDVLVTDASNYTIANNGTDAKLLRALHKKGVQIFNCPTLHAKVLLLNDLAVIGSGNLSDSSRSELVEAALITDHANSVAGAASFIGQLATPKARLSASDITRLCAIEVTRRGWGVDGRRSTPKAKVSTLGNCTWILGVKELVRNRTAAEQAVVDKTVEQLRKREKEPDLDPETLQWGLKSNFSKECKKGDSIIQVWHTGKSRHAVQEVVFAKPVLDKKQIRGRMYFFLGDPTSRLRITWGQFQRLLEQVGHKRLKGTWPQRKLTEDVADAIQRKWRDASKL